MVIPNIIFWQILTTNRTIQIMEKRLLFLLISLLCVGLCSAQSIYTTKSDSQISIPDTVLIRTDRGSTITSRFYVIKGKDMIRVDFYSNSEKCDTAFFEGLDEDDKRRYNHEVYLIKLRSKPIEQINDREAFSYFEIGDSIQHFTSRLGSKKVHVSYTGYQLTFPDEITKKPQVIEFCFYDGILKKIERVTSVNSLPTNDVWTAFQLMQIKESLNDLENAINLLRSKYQTKSKHKESTQRRR